MAVSASAQTTFIPPTAPLRSPAPAAPDVNDKGLMYKAGQVVGDAFHATEHAVDSVFGAHLTYDAKPGQPAVFTNTTGDSLDTQGIFPKELALIAHRKDGTDFVRVGQDADGKNKWLPTTEFKESPGADGVYYLPEYKSNPMGAAITGGIRGFASLAPLGLIPGAAGAAVGIGAGLVSQLLPTQSTTLKALAGAGMGAAALAAVGLLMSAAPAALLALGVVGATVGATGSLGGDGQGKVRDGSYAGTILGAVIPGAAGVLPIAGALGAKAKNPLVQALISAGLAAGLTAATAVALGGAPVLATVAAAAGAGAIAPAAGRAVMDAMRNGAEEFKKIARAPLQKLLGGLGDNELCALTGLPLALLGGSIGMILGPVVGAAAAVALGVVGFAKTRMWLTNLEKQKEEKEAGASDPVAQAVVVPPAVAQPQAA